MAQEWFLAKYSRGGRFGEHDYVSVTVKLADSPRLIGCIFAAQQQFFGINHFKLDRTPSFQITGELATSFGMNYCDMDYIHSSRLKMTCIVWAQHSVFGNLDRSSRA